MKSLALLTLGLAPPFAVAAEPQSLETAVAQEAVSADEAYDTAIRLIDQAERSGGDVKNGAEIFDLGMKAFLADPKDDRAQRVLVYLALLPESISKADLAAYEKTYVERTGALRSASPLSEPGREGLEYLEIYHEVALQSINPTAIQA